MNLSATFLPPEPSGAASNYKPALSLSSAFVSCSNDSGSTASYCANDLNWFNCYSLKRWAYADTLSKAS